jgi:hypothetical protein
VELEIGVRKYPEILHTLYRAECVKPNLFVKEILFSLRIKDIHVVLPALNVTPLSTHHFWIVSVGLQEFTVLNISDVTEVFKSSAN